MSQYENVMKVLQEFDTNQKHPIRNEFDIVKLILQALGGEDIGNVYLWAEYYAFSLLENNKYGIKNWKTNFGPQKRNHEDGSIVEHINLSDITKEVVDYWQSRIDKCTNPILKARYAGLVWEFSPIAKGEKADFKTVGLVYIENLILSGQHGRFSYPFTVFDKLSIGLALAIGFKNQKLKEEAIAAIRTYEKEVGTIDKPGLWKQSYDILIKKHSSSMDESLIKEIISELENRLLRTISPPDGKQQDLNSARTAVEKLIEYYNTKGQFDEIRRVISILAAAYETNITTSTASKAIYQLEQLQEYYNQYNLKTEAGHILKKIQQISPGVMDEMISFPFQFDISKDKIDLFVDEMLNGEVNEILKGLATNFVPPPEARLRIFSESGIMGLFNRSLHDKSGRKVAVVGSAAEDLSGHKVVNIATNLSIEGVLLHFCIDKAKDLSIISESNIMDYITQSSIISHKRHNLIRSGLCAYLQEDYLVCIHQWIPQIEAACLNYLEIRGGSKWKEGKNGGYNLRIFDDVLRDEVFVEAFGREESDYFRVLFTDSRGWNLRNKVCHGMMDTAEFDEQKANRVFVALLLLSTF